MDAGVVAAGCEDDDTNNDDDVGDAASSCSPTKFDGRGDTTVVEESDAANASVMAAL